MDIIGLAQAQTLVAAPPPTDWTSIAIWVAIGLILGLGIMFLRHHPGSVAKAKAESEGLRSELGTVANKATEALRNLTYTHAEAIAKIPAPITTPTPSVVPAPTVPQSLQNGAAATDADIANPSAYFWRVGEMLGYGGEAMVKFVHACNTAIQGRPVDAKTLTDTAAKNL